MNAFAQTSYQLRQRIRHARVFVFRNLREVRNPRLLGRKVRTLFRVHLVQAARFATALPFALLMAIVIRLISPLVVVRIGAVNTTRIGHLAGDPEMQLAEKEIGVGLPERPVFDVFYPWKGPLSVSNHQMLAMWDRSLRLWPAWPWEHVDTVSRLMPWGDRHIVPYRKGDVELPDLQQEDVHGALRRTAPHVWFVDDEIRRALAEIRAAGLDPEREHVCLLVRDDVYLDGVQGGGFADHDFRNADVVTYEPAVRHLLSRGHQVYRMGVGGRKPLLIDDPLFVDYALSGMRSELLDIYLAATCRFFISTATGLDAAAKTFRRPLLVTNLSTLCGLHLTMGVTFIPKHVYAVESGEKLPLSAQYEMGLQNLRLAHEFEKAGVRFEDNSPREILDVVEEVERRIDGSWNSEKFDEQRQAQFLQIVPERFKRWGVTGRIGAAFLRENDEWRR